MRVNLGLAAIIAALSLSAPAFAQLPDQPQQPPVQQDPVPSPKPKPTATPTPPPPRVPPTQIATGAATESVAAAARRAREQRQAQANSKARTFDNDNIPKQGGVSSVGESPAEPADEANGASAPASSSATPAAPGAIPGGSDEKGWRELFERLRHKHDQDQAALDVSQRELNVLDVQYYNDPVKGLQQGLTRSDINEKTAKIEAAKQQLAADDQELSDAEEQLRRAGGDIGWSR